MDLPNLRVIRISEWLRLLNEDTLEVVEEIVKLYTKDDACVREKRAAVLPFKAKVVR